MQNNKKTLWTFGCSFTAEYYPVGESFMRSNYDDYKDWRGGDLPPVWPTLLSNQIDYNLMNCGWGGISNYTIFSKFIQNHKKIKPDDLVIIGWTSLLRFPIVDTKFNEFKDILPANLDSYTYILSKSTLYELADNRSEILWAKQVWEWIFFINSYCDSHNIKIFHWTSDDYLFNNNFVIESELNYFIKKPNNDIYISIYDNLFNYSTQLYSNGLHTIQLETNDIIKDVHSGEFGHKSQATYFYEFLKISNLI